MQIGFVGLGKMGGTMVARIGRDSDHDVVAFDLLLAALRNQFGGHAVKKSGS